MTFNKTSILNFLDKVTDAAKQITPIASEFGIPFVEKVTGWADTAVDIAKNAVERAEEANVVIHSTDKDEINAKITALQAVNDDLAKYIETH